jgi:HEAT repeat protein
VSKARGRFLVVLAGLSALFMGIVLLLPPRPPRYQGKALALWLQALPNNFTFQPLPPNEAEEALRHMGSNAVPYLIQMLRARDSAFVEKVKLQLDRFPAINLAYHHAWQDRIDALKAVAVLGPVAKRAIPEISNILAQGLELNLSLIALDRIGPEAVPALLQTLTITNDKARLVALPILSSRFREQAAQIVPIFLVCLDDPDPDFREEVAKNLRWFGPAARPAIPKLLTMAGPGKEPSEHCEAVRTLGAVDPEGALRVFLEELEGPDAKARAAAAESLGWLEHAGGPAVPALIKHLHDPDNTVRRAAALALGDIGQEPDLVVPALLDTLEGEDLRLRTFSALALSKFGDRAKSAVPVIQALIEEHKTNEFYNAELHRALRKIDPRAAPGTALDNR